MANWALIENHEITELHDSLPRDWRNISGLHLQHENLEWLRDIGWLPIQHAVVEYDVDRQEIFDYRYDLYQDHVAAHPLLRDKPKSESMPIRRQAARLGPFEEDAVRELIAQEIKRTILDHIPEFLAQIPGMIVESPAAGNIDTETATKLRNQLLRQTDFTQLDDVRRNLTSEQNQAWTDYRQKLRDIPDNWRIDASLRWPIMPTYEKKDRP